MTDKKGVRVIGTFEVFSGIHGTIIDYDEEGWYLVEWDESSRVFHGGDGRGKNGHCYWVRGIHIIEGSPLSLENV